MSDAPHYELFYWPTIQGRGEFIRLAFEAAGVDYVDVARKPASEGGGPGAIMALIGDATLKTPPLAPPILRVGSLVLAQVASILQYLGPRLALAPEDEAARVWANQLQLTIADLVAEAHDTHHPISGALYYEDQKPEARRRAEQFVTARMPKFLGYFERALVRNGGTYAVGDRTSYVDLSLFQVMTGLGYAFPSASERLAPTLPHLHALRERVASIPGVAAYLASDRRLAPSEKDVFRRYPELDV